MTKEKTKMKSLKVPAVLVDMAKIVAVHEDTTITTVVTNLLREPLIEKYGSIISEQAKEDTDGEND